MKMFNKIKDLSLLAATFLAGLQIVTLLVVGFAVVAFFLTGCAGLTGIPTAQEREAYIDKWKLSAQEANNIRTGKVWIGASWRDAHASLGKPHHARITTTRSAEYLTMQYPCHNLYFRDGILETIQDSVRCYGPSSAPLPALPYPGFGVRQY